MIVSSQLSVYNINTLLILQNFEWMTSLCLLLLTYIYIYIFVFTPSSINSKYEYDRQRVNWKASLNSVF
jgi:hypothetical protein